MDTMLGGTTVTIEDQPPARGEVTPRVHITVQGIFGAARAVIWQWGGQSLGVVGIHAVMPQREGQEPHLCDVMPGCCYDGDGSMASGVLAAELYYSGSADAAVAEVESWYCSRMDPEACL